MERNRKATAVDAAALIREITGGVTGQVPVTKPQHVAVAGGGISGLQAAWTLARQGYAVTVFERRNSPGGSLMHLSSDLYVDKAVLRAGLETVLAAGIEFRCGVTAGVEPTIDELKAQGFDVILLAVGRDLGEKPDWPECRLPWALDVVTAMETIAAGAPKDWCGRCAVIFGDDSMAVDCARALRDLGGTAVLVSQTDMAHAEAGAAELELARSEGVRLIWGAVPLQLREEDGTITGVICGVVERFEAGKPVTGDKRLELPCDTVIFARHRRPDTAEIERCSGVRARPCGHMLLGDHLDTNVPGVLYARNGAEGARAVINYLTGGTEKFPVPHPVRESYLLK
jgi:NADPH-dependent glutamate synthase beta subunit-like oxidoreductase